MSPGVEIRQREERLRYEVLRCVYQRAGLGCDLEVDGAHVAMALGLRLGEVDRIAYYLARRGHLASAEGGSRMRITESGVRYVEEVARRRRSVRD